MKEDNGCNDHETFKKYDIFFGGGRLVNVTWAIFKIRKENSIFEGEARTMKSWHCNCIAVVFSNDELLTPLTSTNST